MDEIVELMSCCDRRARRHRFCIVLATKYNIGAEEVIVQGRGGRCGGDWVSAERVRVMRDGQ